MDLHKVTKASISIENSSPAAFLHAVDIYFFDRVCFLSLLWTVPELSVTCTKAVTEVISMETEHISHGNKSRDACYFYQPYPLHIDRSSNESVISVYSFPLILMPQHLIIFNALALTFSEPVLMVLSQRRELEEWDAHRLDLSLLTPSSPFVS